MKGLIESKGKTEAAFNLELLQGFQRCTSLLLFIMDEDK